MKKYRILVRAFTARRDVMTFKVIEKFWRVMAMKL